MISRVFQTESKLFWTSITTLLSFVVFLSYTGVSYRLEAQEMTAQVVDERRAQLERELAELEAQIAQQRELLQNKQGERKTLERDIAILDGQIKKAKLAIQARDLVIRKISGEITNKQLTISELNEKLKRQQESLARLVQQTDEIDDMSMVEIVLSNHSLSEFFEELDDFQSLKSAIHQSFVDINAVKTDTEVEKRTLESKHEEEMELKRLQELEAQKVQEQERQKGKILETTKGQERAYQSMIAQNEQTAAQIRAALFELRGSAAIPFGKALEYATAAGARTGVRPALILGILKQETKLGEFLGNGTWSVDMHPTRDRPLFQVITATLGLNPDSMPVSKQPSYGWGGAMGPGQFIPSTWACYGGYINTVTGDCSNKARSLTWDQFWAGPWVYDANQDRIRNMLGKSVPANPWEARDAFMGTGILMMENGAAGGNFASERLAALRYFAGWGNAENPSYAFYGDSVMEHATYFQQQIDTLKQLEN